MVYNCNIVPNALQLDKFRLENFEVLEEAWWAGGSFELNKSVGEGCLCICEEREGRLVISEGFLCPFEFEFELGGIKLFNG